MQFLSNAFPRYYGRISTTKIDIKYLLTNVGKWVDSWKEVV